MASRRTVNICRNFSRGFGTHRQFKKPNVGLRTTALIAAPCSCYVAWQAWKKLTQNLPTVSASELDTKEVCH